MRWACESGVDSRIAQKIQGMRNCVEAEASKQEEDEQRDDDDDQLLNSDNANRFAMDRNTPILRFPAPTYAPIPDSVRIQMPNCRSPPPEELSEASASKDAELHILQTSSNGAHLLDNEQSVRYRECQKNHAANIGGLAFDGCGEFLPGGKEGTVEALNCAACSCHRNFHRKVLEGEQFCCGCNEFLRNRALSGSPTPAFLALPSCRDVVSHAHMVMSLSSPPIHPDEQHNLQSGSSSKKRYRTKFTFEQKEKMSYFAERLGWRFSKQDEEAIQVFCNDIGVGRNVFKVWMHNNKHNLAKRL